eukprot:scaffold57145_cov36-Tisochrysis_lutea.AAC.4
MPRLADAEVSKCTSCPVINPVRPGGCHPACVAGRRRTREGRDYTYRLLLIHSPCGSATLPPARGSAFTLHTHTPLAPSEHRPRTKPVLDARLSHTFPFPPMQPNRRGLFL